MPLLPEDTPLRITTLRVAIPTMTGVSLRPRRTASTCRHGCRRRGWGRAPVRAYPAPTTSNVDGRRRVRPAAGHRFRSPRSGRLAYGYVRPIRQDGGPASYYGMAHGPCPERRAMLMMGATCPNRLRGLALPHTAAAAPPHARSRFAHAAGRCTRTGAAPGARCRVVAPMRFRCDGATVATPGTHRGTRRWPNPPAPRAPATARDR